MIIVPDDGLHSQRQGAKMTLMSNSGYKLQPTYHLSVTTRKFQFLDTKEQNKRKMKTHMLEIITRFCCWWRNQTRSTHSVKQILPKNNNFLGVKFNSANCTMSHKLRLSDELETSIWFHCDVYRKNKNDLKCSLWHWFMYQLLYQV